MKKIILITMLMSAVFAQSDCNKDNWQEYYNSEGRDMTECYLRNSNLMGANLEGANLTGADLIGTNLSGANLTGANLEGANPSGANLEGANLSGANLTGANLGGTDLTGASLEGANLSEANLSGVISSNIRGVPDNLREGWSLVDGKFVIVPFTATVSETAKRAQQEAAQKAAAAKKTAEDNFSEFIPEGYNLNSWYFADFNKDGNDDCVLVVKATWRDNVLNRFGDSVDRNRRGIIILLKDNKGYKLVEKILDCFSSENEDGGVYFPPQLSIITKKGILIIEYDHGRYGNWKYTFRYQEEAFKLIGYDIKEMHFLDYWLQSINFLSKKKLYSSKEEGVLKEDWSNFTIDKLITLSEIENFDVGYNEQILNIIN